MIIAVVLISSLLLFEVYLRKRAQKIYELSLTYEGRRLTMKEMSQVQKKFWVPVEKALKEVRKDG